MDITKYKCSLRSDDVFLFEQKRKILALVVYFGAKYNATNIKICFFILRPIIYQLSR